MKIVILILALFIILGGCSNITNFKGKSVLETSSVTEERAREQEPLKSKDSYVVFGKRYFPISDASDFEETGVASWYGAKFHGRPTSSGELYDMHAMTAAHKTLPLGSYVKVDNLENSKTIMVNVNDRGPFVDGRIIDLSYAAAKDLAMTRQGTAIVKVTVISFPHQKTHDDSVVNYRYIQLGAFRNKKNALKLIENVNSSLGHRIVGLVETKDSWYKVLTLSKGEISSETRSVLKTLGISNYSYVAER